MMRTPHALSLVLALALVACASTPSSSPGDPADDGPAAAVTTDMVTVENLLRWSLEGQTGVDKVTAELKQMFELQEYEGSRLAGEGPVHLVDGYILSFTSIGPGITRIDIGVEQEPCFSPQLAVELTGAVQSPVIRDMHGVDRGKTYKAQRNGIAVDFNTIPVTYRCVDSIHVSQIKEPRR